jgi:hypothetical protein
VLEMLLSHLEIVTSQTKLTAAIKAEEYIDDRGTTPKELAQACAKITTKAQFWYKEHTTIEDLDALINQYKYPVGVEWQNLFYDSVEEEFEDTDGQPFNYDFGHYSVVSQIDTENDEIVMIDPYFEFEDTYRYFSLSWFETRWWDRNKVQDPDTHHIKRIRDERVSFIITIKGTPFPKILGYKPL